MSTYCVRVSRFTAASMLIVMLSAIAQAQSVTLLPASYTFPNQAIDTPSQPEAFTLKNGDDQLHYPDHYNWRRVQRNRQLRLVPGAGKSCTINARFRPTLAQLYSNEKLNVTYNTNKSVYSLLSGTGIPDVSLSPAIGARVMRLSIPPIPNRTTR